MCQKSETILLQVLSDNKELSEAWNEITPHDYQTLQVRIGGSLIAPN
jgi:hypothetical protein